MSIAEIANQLYAERLPTTPLYHYTSIRGLLGIVPGGKFQATDIQYLSDSEEVKHTSLLLRIAMTLDPPKDEFSETIRRQLLAVLDQRFGELGPMVFVGCFTANGNLLSQWRGYSEPGKGISLGFHPEKLAASAASQSWRIGRCVYDVDQQQLLAKQILSELESLVRKAFPKQDRISPDGMYNALTAIEGDLLRVAALLKNPQFHEEQEWRLVSPVVTNQAVTPIEYREGRSTLTPYLNFTLPSSSEKRVDLEHVYVGPAQSSNHTMSSVSTYLTRNRSNPLRGITYCAIPHRTW
jgi:hypothetical protein